MSALETRVRVSLATALLAAWLGGALARATGVEELRLERVGTIKGTFMVEALAAAGVPAASVDASILTGQLPDALRSGRITVAVDGLEAALVAKASDPAPLSAGRVAPTSCGSPPARPKPPVP